MTTRLLAVVMNDAGALYSLQDQAIMEQAVVLLANIFGDWFDQKISSKVVPERIGPVNEHIDRALEIAGKLMTEEYGVTKTELCEMRAESQGKFKSVTSWLHYVLAK